MPCRDFKRHTALLASSILGCLVVIWHIPLVLLGLLPAFALFATFAFTIVFGWLFNNVKGSVLMTLIAHAADGLILTGNSGLNPADSERHKSCRHQSTRAIDDFVPEESSLNHRRASKTISMSFDWVPADRQHQPR